MENKTRKLKFGIIGAGRIGRIHAENLALHISEAEVLAVTDIIREAAVRCAADFRIPQSFKDYRRILSLPERPSAIFDATSTM